MDNWSSTSIETESAKDLSKKLGKKSRKPYRKPHLRKLGDLRSLTLGPTFGRGESGSLDLTHKSPFFP
jgi:hypothetical protein